VTVLAAGPRAHHGLLSPDAAPIDLSRTRFPPPLRPAARLAVLDITKYFGEQTGGIRTYLLEKARYVESDPSLRQVLVVPGAADTLTESSGVRCYRLRGPRIPTEEAYRFLLATRTTRRILDHERPQVIEVGSPFFVPWITRHANRGLRAPMVWFFHTHLPRILGGDGRAAGFPRRRLGALAWSYFRRLNRLFHATLVASESVARELQLHGFERVHRVPLGVDLDHFHPSRRAAAIETRRRFGLPDAPLALFLGRFAREKQLDVVLRAWPEIERRTGAALLLVGNGPARERLGTMSRGKRVCWLPFQGDRGLTADLLASADLYIAPGPAETFGLSALEAMASGIPVLSVDQGGVADRISASGAGALYPVGDAGALAQAAIRLFDSGPADLGMKARRYAELHHSWASAFDEIFKVYRAVVDERPGL
jgi:alpha-1,6-mannosyltransferase